jgi:hypothetical protein
MCIAGITDDLGSYIKNWPHAANLIQPEPQAVSVLMVF